MNNNILQHYGILGMKWGVRRSRASLDRLANRKAERSERKAARAEQRTNQAPKKIAKTSGTSNLSDNDLQTRINRLRMESQYKQLLKELDPTTVEKGRRVTGETVKTIGTTAATTATLLAIYNNADAIKKIFIK
jgi:hypothetical protein